MINRAEACAAAMDIVKKALENYKRKVEEKKKMKEDCLLFLSDFCDSWNECGTPAARVIYSGYDDKTDLYYIKKVDNGTLLWAKDGLSFEEEFVDYSDALWCDLGRDLEHIFEYLEENNMPTIAINPVSGKVTVNDIAFGDWWDKYVMYTSKVKETESKIKRVIFNAPATIILWKDGTKTVVKCGENETYDPEKGLAMCLVKHQLGNKGNYNNLFRKYLKEVE